MNRLECYQIGRKRASSCRVYGFALVLILFLLCICPNAYAQQAKWSAGGQRGQGQSRDKGVRGKKVKRGHSIVTLSSPKDVL
jgi:hypothetical protein